MTKNVRRYRVHLVITAEGFERPESFRVEAYADEPWKAERAAVEWLAQQPLTGAHVLAVMSIERVPQP